MCLYAEDASRGGLEKKKEETQFYSKSNTGIEVFPTQVGHPLQVIQHAQADHPSGLAALTWRRSLHILYIFYLFEGQRISYNVECA